MDRELEGKSAIVTGGARGIGLATARLLGRRGARVALLDLRQEAADEAARALREEGCAAHGRAVDVRERAAVQRALDAVVAQAGDIDIIVNNAAVGPTAAFLDLTDAQWSLAIDTNLTGAFIVAQEGVRRMARTARGRIVNVASVAAHTGHSGQAAYASAKAGLTALTHVMAFELGPLGITVNAVSPGTIETELAAGMLTDEARRARVERIPVGRLGQPEEVAELVAFLASPRAAYVNGEVVVIDGGFLRAGIRAGAR